MAPESAGDAPILLVCSEPLYPVSGGGAARVLSLVRALRAHGYPVELVSPHVGKRAARALHHEFDALWCTSALAYRRVARGAVRTVGKLLPLAMSESITRHVDSALLEDTRQRIGGHLPGDETAFMLNRADPDLCDLLGQVARRRNPRAVIAEFAWTALALDELPPQVLRILDTHDIQHHRRAQARSLGRDIAGHECTIEEERLEWSRADVLIAIQARECEVMRDMLPCHETIVVEHTLDAEPLPHEPAAAQVLFVGNRYDPNILGIERFLDEAWPAVRKAVPNARLVVCGTVCDGLSGAIPEGVTLAGRVGALEPYYAAAAVVINPVPYGTGLKIKTVESLVYGRCLVSTRAGVLGLEDDVEGSPVIVCAIEAMAAPIVELLRDPEARRNREAHVAAYARERFSRQRVYGSLIELLRRAAPSPSGILERREFSLMLGLMAQGANRMKNGLFRPVAGGKIEPWTVSHPDAVAIHAGDGWNTVIVSPTGEALRIAQTLPWEGPGPLALRCLAQCGTPDGLTLTVCAENAAASDAPIARIVHPGDGQWHCLTLATERLPQGGLRHLVIEIATAPGLAQEARIRAVVACETALSRP